MKHIKLLLFFTCVLAFSSCITPEVSVLDYGYGYHRPYGYTYRYHVYDAMIPEKFKLPTPNRVSVFKPRHPFPEPQRKPRFMLIRKPEYKNKNTLRK